MALSGFSVKGYKSFAERASVELRPLTLVFGPNAAGKSALLRTPPFLARSSEHGAAGKLAFGQQGHSDFQTSVSRYAKTSEMEFSLRWTNSPISEYKIAVRNFDGSSNNHITSFEIVRSDQRSLKASWVPTSLTKKYSTYSVTADQRTDDLNVIMDGISPRNEDIHDWEMVALDFFLPLRSAIGDLSRTAWLTALRQVPPRFEVVGDTPPHLGIAGEGLTAVLNSYGETSPLFSEVSSWLARITGNELDLVRGVFRNRDLISLTVVPHRSEEGPVRVDICDTGEGISQVLPVITLGALVKAGAYGQGPTVVIEHPELHLHPSAQDDLAEFLCDVATSEVAPKLMLETHSENFVLTIQLAIVEGRIAPSDVIVHWVKSTSSGAEVSTFSFDEYGRPTGGPLPHGLFTEAADQARKLLKKRTEKQTNAPSAG